MRITLQDKYNLVYQNVEILVNFDTPQSFLARFIELGTMVLNADFGYSFILTGQDIALWYKDKKTPYLPRKPRRHGIVNKTLREQEPQTIDNVQSIPWIRFDAKKNMKSVTVIPILASDNAIFGTLLFCYKKKHTFSSEDFLIIDYLSRVSGNLLEIHLTK